MRPRWTIWQRSGAVIAAGGFLLCAQQAGAERFANDIAVFSALDKVTARISRIEVALNETHRFGSLMVTPRVCFTRPATERPKTTSFVEVNEVLLDGAETRLFSGWMFAESPGINAVEHPVFDVWLIGCRSNQPQTADAARTDDSTTAQPAVAQPRRQTRRRRRRVRR